MRVEGGKMMKNGGWFFPFDADKPLPPPPHVRSAPKPTVDCGALMRDWRAQGGDLQPVSDQLGVSSRSLEFLGVCWSVERDAAAFPMYDATGHNRETPIGIRLRTMDGHKFAVTGSRSGIFYPYVCYRDILPWKRLFICEGPTDTAACLDLGIFAIGRAACRGGKECVLSVLDQLQPDEVVIVMDNDGPGVAGANDLMRHIKQPKRAFVPPGKDLRKFMADGATVSIIDAMLKNTLLK